ncbi:MAG: AMP-binding protein [Verrucomicrobiota bacterium]
MNSKTLSRNWNNLEAGHACTLQAAQFRRFLAHKVLPFSKHYRRVFADAGLTPSHFKSLDDLRRIPFTSKDDLLPDEENPQKIRDFVLVPEPAQLARRPENIARALLRGKKYVTSVLNEEFRPVLMTSTTGRSTSPVPFVYTKHDLNILETTGARLMEIGETEPDFRHFNLFPFAPHLAFWQAHYAGLGATVFNLSTGGGKALGTDATLGLLDRVQPNALIGMPTFIYHLLQEATENNLSLTGLRKLVLGGEKVPQGARRKLRALAAELGAGNVDVMATYGFTEARMAWPECPSSSHEPTGYHLFPDLGIVEIIDPESGEPLPHGSPGEIVYTPIDGRGTVVLRYRTGDFIDGGLVHTPCPACGRNLPRLIGNISRVSDYRQVHSDKIKGTLVNFNELEHILDDLEHVGAWQIELRKVDDNPLERDELLVHVHKTGRISDRDLARNIENRFLKATEVRPNDITFHSPAEMRRLHGLGKELKEKRFVDNRPGDSPAPQTKPKPKTPISTLTPTISQ